MVSDNWQRLGLLPFYRFLIWLFLVVIWASCLNFESLVKCVLSFFNFLTCTWSAWLNVSCPSFNSSCLLLLILVHLHIVWISTQVYQFKCNFRASIWLFQFKCNFYILMILSFSIDIWCTLEYLKVNMRALILVQTPSLKPTHNFTNVGFTSLNYG